MTSSVAWSKGRNRGVPPKVSNKMSINGTVCMLRSNTGTDPVGPDAAATGVAVSGWAVGRLGVLAWSGTGVADPTEVGTDVGLLKIPGVGVPAPPQAHNPSTAKPKSNHRRCTGALASGTSIVLIMVLFNEFTKIALAVRLTQQEQKLSVTL